jgi:2-C-methyl-D-erythritol 2,4-cyclodiphosphate synthase/2-C-methyl-D-erythritol 4-phosphate cytidylyltransferase
MQKIGVIVTAAGQSVRMGNRGNKLFIRVEGETVIRRAVMPFVLCGFEPICVVVSPDRLGDFEYELASLPVEIVSGGETRQDSVYRGLKALGGRCTHVLIHDGARPFVSGELLARVTEGTLARGACIPVVPLTDTIYRTDALEATEVLERSELAGAQTPQGFSYEVIVRAHEESRLRGNRATDDGGLLLAVGHRPLIVEGDIRNKKITTPEDIMECPRPDIRVGLGVDVHRLVEGRELVLAGVVVPYHKGLLGHSDADVVTHAVMDALLGSIGAEDIGVHFPDSDPAHKGANSLHLLREVGKLLSERGATILSVDATLLLERPKIAPYREEMRYNLAAALGLPTDRVSVKATTTEGLGYVGLGEGAVCHAVASVRL